MAARGPPRAMRNTHSPPQTNPRRGRGSSPLRHGGDGRAKSKGVLEAGDGIPRDAINPLGNQQRNGIEFSAAWRGAVCHPNVLFLADKCDEHSSNKELPPACPNGRMRLVPSRKPRDQMSAKNSAAGSVAILVQAWRTVPSAGLDPCAQASARTCDSSMAPFDPWAEAAAELTGRGVDMSPMTRVDLTSDAPACDPFSRSAAPRELQSAEAILAGAARGGTSRKALAAVAAAAYRLQTLGSLENASLEVSRRLGDIAPVVAEHVTASQEGRLPKVTGSAKNRRNEALHSFDGVPSRSAAVCTPLQSDMLIDGPATSKDISTHLHVPADIRRAHFAEAHARRSDAASAPRQAKQRHRSAPSCSNASE